MEVFTSGETERVVSGFEEASQMIFDETGLVIKPFVATEYASVIEAVCSNPHFYDSACQVLDATGVSPVLNKHRPVSQIF